MREPEHAAHAEGQSEFPAHVVVVEGLVVPVAVAEHDTAHGEYVNITTELI